MIRSSISEIQPASPERPQAGNRTGYYPSSSISEIQPASPERPQAGNRTGYYPSSSISEIQPASPEWPKARIPQNEGAVIKDTFPQSKEFILKSNDRLKYYILAKRAAAGASAGAALALASGMISKSPGLPVNDMINSERIGQALVVTTAAGAVWGGYVGAATYYGLKKAYQATAEKINSPAVSDIVQKVIPGATALAVASAGVAIHGALTGVFEKSIAPAEFTRSVGHTAIDQTMTELSVATGGAAAIVVALTAKKMTNGVKQLRQYINNVSESKAQDLEAGKAVALRPLPSKNNPTYAATSIEDNALNLGYSARFNTASSLSPVDSARNLLR